MGLDSQQVISDGVCDIGQHDVRRKLEGWKFFMVSQH